MGNTVQCETCIHKTVCSHMQTFKEYLLNASINLPVAPYPIVVTFKCSEYFELRVSRSGNTHG